MTSEHSSTGSGRNNDTLLGAAFDVLHTSEAVNKVIAKAAVKLERHLMLNPSLGFATNDAKSVDEFIAKAGYGDLLSSMMRQVEIIWTGMRVEKGQSPFKGEPDENFQNSLAQEFAGYARRIFPKEAQHYKQKKQDLIHELMETGLEEKVAGAMLDAIENQYLKSYQMKNALSQFHAAMELGIQTTTPPSLSERSR